MAVIIGVLIGYMVLISAVSILSPRLSKRVKHNTTVGYLLAGKSLPWGLVAVMIAGGAVGGAATIGTAQNAYTLGMSASWYGISLVASPLVFSLLLGSKLRKLQITTVPQLFRRYFGEKAALVLTVISLVSMVGFLSSQIIAGGAIVAAIVPEIPYQAALIVTTVVFFLITFFGGYFGASTSNAINVVVIYAGIALALIVGIGKFGGTEAIAAALPEGDHWFNLVSGTGLGPALGTILVFCVSDFTTQDYYQATAASRDDRTAKIGFIAAAIICAPIGFLASYLGIIAAGAFPGIESSLALPMVVVSFNPVIAGLCLAGLWAADVSTATGLICYFTSISLNDVVLKYLRPSMSDRGQLIFSKSITVLVVLCAFVIALGASNIINIIISIAGLKLSFAFVLILVLFFPKLLRRSSFAVVVSTGSAGWLLYMLIPGLQAFFGQVFWMVFPLCILAWLATLIFDKRKFGGVPAACC